MVFPPTICYDFLMKIKDLFFLLLILPAFQLLSCTTADTAEKNKVLIPSASGGEQNADEAFPAENWMYRIEKTNEGSRSEGSVSRLFYRYSEIPPVFSKLIIGGHVFEYVPPAELWDSSGYIFRVGEDGGEIPAARETISRTELKNGWYHTDSARIKGGTPKNWIYAETESMSVWISPESISDFVELFSLTALKNRKP